MLDLMCFSVTIYNSLKKSLSVTKFSTHVSTEVKTPKKSCNYFKYDTSHKLPLPFVIKHPWRLKGMHKSRRGVPGHSTAEPPRDGVSLVGDLDDIVLLLGALPHPPDPVVGTD